MVLSLRLWAGSAAGGVGRELSSFGRITAKPTKATTSAAMAGQLFVMRFNAPWSSFGMGYLAALCGANNGDCQVCPAVSGWFLTMPGRCRDGVAAAKGRGSSTGHGDPAAATHHSNRNLRLLKV